MDSDFFQTHSDLECVFYDRDIKKLSRAFDDVYDVFKSIRKRVERKDTMKVARSTFDFYNRQEEVTRHPHNVFHFHDDISHISLEFNSKEKVYEVHSVGYNLPRSEFYNRVSSSCGVCGSELSHGITAYRDTVHKYCLEKNGVLL